MKTLEDLARERNVAAKKVREWMAAEGAKGNVRQNFMCPDWFEYEDAQKALDDALAKVS